MNEKNALMLLIGSNPLPNYVVLNYLLDKKRDDSDLIPRPDIVFLIHSKDTEKYAKNIENKCDFKNFEKIDLGEKERNSKEIKKKISEKLSKYNDLKTIHLCYTGGTKPMAVNSYAVLVEKNKNNVYLILSDLNPKNFKLSVEKDDTEYEYPTSGDLRDYVKLNIDDIFDLYYEDRNIPDKKQVESEILEISDAIASEVFSDYDKVKFLKKVDDTLGKILDKRKRDKDKLSEILGSKKDVKLDKDIYESLEIDKDKINFFAPENLGFLLPYFNFDENGKATIKQNNLLKIIKGEWLEYYMDKNIKNMKEELNIQEIKPNIIFKDEKNEAEIEIDVLATKGYQLFLFSCTTSTKKSLIKEKGFEALFRAEQLGGEHSKVILVNLMSKSEPQYRKLEKDFKQFDADNNLEIICYEELKEPEELKNRLRKIFIG